MRLLSEFLQGVGRTTARNKLDPSVSRLARADVVKYVRTFIVPTSVQGMGSVKFTVSKIHQIPHGGPTLVFGCADQSKLVQVSKDGRRFVAGAKDFPTLKMSATIDRTMTGPRVTHFTFAVGTC